MSLSKKGLGNLTVIGMKFLRDDLEENHFLELDKIWFSCYNIIVAVTVGLRVKRRERAEPPGLQPHTAIMGRGHW
jgi:hypothetical protein